MDELEHEHRRMHETTQRDESIEQIKTMQTWGEAQGADLMRQKQEFSDGIIAFQTQYDEQLIERMKQGAPRTEVREAAPVAEPPVQAPAAREGYKARRERAKKRRKAQKLCPVGDEYTLDMAREIRELNTGRDAAITPEITERAESAHCDKRVLRVFCEEIRLDKKGRPATDVDRQIMHDNQEFMMNYTSGSARLRKPYLDRFTKQILDIQLTPDMFMPQNIVEHAVEYKKIGDRLTYFENMQHENPEYFDSLPEYQKELIAAKLKAGVAFVAAFAQHMNARGVDFNNGEIYSERPPIEMGLGSRDFLTEQYNLSLDTLGGEVEAAKAKEVNRLTQIEMDRLKPAYKMQDEELEREYGVSFPGGASELQYGDMKKYRDMIADHPEEYKRNKEIIDEVFTDFYKALSQIGESSLIIRARQGVVDDYNDYRDEAKHVISMKAEFINEEADKSITALSHYGNELMDIMEHLLRGKPLLESVEPILERYRARVSHADDPSDVQ